LSHPDCEVTEPLGGEEITMGVGVGERVGVEFCVGWVPAVVDVGKGVAACTDKEGGVDGAGL
jgi:hypothetical protein